MVVQGTPLETLGSEAHTVGGGPLLPTKLRLGGVQGMAKLGSLCCCLQAVGRRYLSFGSLELGPRVLHIASGVSLPEKDLVTGLPWLDTAAGGAVPQLQGAPLELKGS